MLDSLSICRLYNNVLHSDMQQHCVSQEAIRMGIQYMSHVYKPATGSLNSGRSVVADYNDAANRCAYMHKYAGLHTAMVKDMLLKAIEVDFEFFFNLLFSDNSFNICSLGGGPGSDIIGALAAFHGSFPYFNSSVTIIDYMENWSFSFQSILKELGKGLYGAFGNDVSQYLNWRYIGANLLKSNCDVNAAVSCASLVTMVKFASAAACQDTESMLKKIFAAMKPGACVLFIDNDGGGFHKIFLDAAHSFNFYSIFGPLRHHNYENLLVKTMKFGYNSCYKTTVVFQILQKPFCERFGIPQRLSLLGSPLTPILYCGNVDIKDNYLRSPTSELPQTPVSVMYSPHNIENTSPTPNTQRRRRRKINPCCLPLRNLRRSLARKINQIKLKARKVLFHKKSRNGKKSSRI